MDLKTHFGLHHPFEIHLNLGMQIVLDHFLLISAWHHTNK
jgi:hypothetical protein